MPDPKSHPELPNPATHGDGGGTGGNEEAKPTGMPTPDRHATETAHHDEETQPADPAKP